MAHPPEHASPCTQAARIEQLLQGQSEILDELRANRDDHGQFRDRLTTLEVTSRVEGEVAAKYESAKRDGKHPWMAALRAVPPWGWIVVFLVRGPELLEVLMRWALKALGVE